MGLCLSQINAVQRQYPGWVAGSLGIQSSCQNFLEVNCNALSRYSVDNVTVTYNGKVALHGANLLLVSGSIGASRNEWQR